GLIYKNSFVKSTFSRLFHEFEPLQQVKWTHILNLFSEDHFLKKKVDFLVDYFHIGPLLPCTHTKEEHLVDRSRAKKDSGPFSESVPCPFL
ncbi:MAG: hypothetical protein J6B43_09890, partial [Lachnospiraceae bacterium]|nr:hypothetical protein [Lachnospiraceae bacterium]